MTDTHTPQAGIADALSQLSEETRELVRQEIESARDETWDKAKALAPGLALVGLGGVMGAAAGASAYRLVLRVLERLLGPALAAMVATAGFAAAGAAALAAGREQLSDVSPPVPSQTARRAGEEVREVASAR